MDEFCVLARSALALAARGERAALATLVAVDGSSLRREGARILVGENGDVIGHLSGGCLEGDLAERAKKVIATSTPQIVKYKPGDHDPVFGLGSGCASESSIFVEPLTNQLLNDLKYVLDVRAFETITATCVFGEGTRFTHESSARASAASAPSFVEEIEPVVSLLVFGAGPPAQPLASIAKTLGWRVVIADHRSEFADRVSGADETVVADPEKLVERVRFGARPAAVLVSHLWNLDVQILRDLLSRDVPYIGLLGSRKRRDGILEALRGDAQSASAIWSIHRNDAEESGRALRVPAVLEIKSLHAPAGLALGGETPAEIALAIIAEVEATLRGGEAKSLRDTTRPTHRSLRTAAVILAAGESNRYGAPKQLADFHGKPMLRHVVDQALASRTGRIFVVVGANADRVRGALAGADVEIVENREWQSGMSSSLHAAIAALGTGFDSMLVLLADQPHVTTADIDRFIQTYASTRPQIVATRYPEGGGVPALFDASLFEMLKSLEGDSGARDVIRKLPEVTVVIDAVTTDVDTPHDR